MNTVTLLPSRCLMLGCQDRSCVRPWIGRSDELFDLLIGLIEGCIESDGAAGEVQTADETGGFCTSMNAVHADIFPLDGERTTVADIIECDDEILKLDVTAAGRTEVPEASGIAKVSVATEDAY